MSSEQIPPQAANNATGQQLQAAPPSIAAPASSSGSIDSLQCQWAGCSDRAATAEQLYEHVCERHVGRKSTNNLNLTCQWGNCHTTTVKRDHITSHIRVHVPLKPHKCDFCGKSFKRPQDLKKHVKTHADESVLMRSPEPASGSRHHPNGGYGNMNNQPRPGQGGYYSEPQMQQNMPMSYGAFPGHAPNGGSHAGYYAPTAQSTSQSYGPVYYNVTNGNDTGNQASYSDRKRGTELVDNLFGSIKRHEFDPHSYSEISNRLVPFHNVQLPLLSGGGGGGMSEYQSGPGLMSSHAGSTTLFAPTAPHGYSLPIPNLRTKQDMVDAENYLQNMVQTAYESSTSVAVAGVAQPGAHHISTGLTLRTSTSPPGMPMGSAHMRDAHSSHASTPQLTPGSSHGSHYSEHSPTSGVSPTEQHHPIPQSSAYPTLPNASSMAGQAPSSTLGNQYDHDIRRRYSGGRLQKAAPGSIKPEDEMDIDERRSSTPKQEHKTRSVSKNLIDPALSGYTHSGSSSPTPTPSASGGEVDETWVYNVRLLEDLKKYVSARLERGEFEEDEGGMEQEEQKSLYPVLK